MRIPTHIMVHHSLTSDGETVSAAAIEKYHIETMGWRDVGYHALVEKVTNSKDLYRYRFKAIFGRPISQFASACPQGQMNQVALHVCCVGNYDVTYPEPDMLSCLLKRVILPWADEFNIPVENWVGHRDYNKDKTCPGHNFNMDYLRDLGR